MGEIDCERLIWQLNPTALLEQPLVDQRSWPGVVQHELRQFGAQAALRTPAAPAPAVQSVAVVMMMKDEADIIGENLAWLHHIGVRRFVLSDNGSTDATPDIVRRFHERFRDSEVVRVTDPLVRYMQAEKTTGLYRLAMSVWPDLRWVIPVDADEFLIAERGLAVLDEVDGDVDAVSLPKVIHFRRGQATGQSGTGDPTSVMQRMDLRSTLFTVPPKVVLRTNLFATITQGNHKVRFVDDRPPVYAGGFSRGLYYREFPTRSFEHMLRKVRNGGRAILAAEAFLGRKVGGEHWVDYYNQLQAGGEEHLLAVYRRDWIRDSGAGLVSDPFAVAASGLA